MKAKEDQPSQSNDDHTVRNVETKDSVNSIPSRCPFSGVNFDPALLMEWEAKLKMNTAEDDDASRLHNFHQSKINDKTLPQNHESSDVPVLRDLGDWTSVRRIQITNSQSRRSKDLLVEPSPSETVFDKIYNHPGVKSANIRKWNSETVQGVKDRTKEIRLQLEGRLYTLDELKELSTEELFLQCLDGSQVEKDAALLNLNLLCVDTTET